MKKLFVLLTALFTLAQMDAQEKNVIRIPTDDFIRLISAISYWTRKTSTTFLHTWKEEVTEVYPPVDGKYIRAPAPRIILNRL